jgi:hypothetical protein
MSTTARARSQAKEVFHLVKIDRSGKEIYESLRGRKYPYCKSATAHTDAEDDRLTGNKTEAVKNRYGVKPEIVKPAK